MGVLNKLTYASLHQNRRRTIVTMIGVALSAALIFTVIAIPVSYFFSLKNYQAEFYGDYHEVFENVPGDKLGIVENANGVASYYYSEPVTDFGIEYSYLENSSQPYPSSLYTRIDHIDEADRISDKRFSVYVKYSNPKRNIRFGKDIMYAFEDADLAGNINNRKNSYYLQLDGDIDYNTTTVVTCLGAFIVGVLAIASIFTIRNSFNISTTERTREFGMLSSVGATPRQIRRTVFLEAVVIAAVAVPVGIALGILATSILLVLSNALLGLDTFAMRLAVPWWLVVADAAIGVIIVWLSSASAAIRAGRLSPIEAIRSSRDVKINARKLKTSRIIKSYFGAGGVIASKNLKRSRAKYRTTVISIVVSVAVFIGMSSFAIDGNRFIDSMFSDFGADYIIFGADEKQYQEIVDKFSLDDYVIAQDVSALGGYGVTLLSPNYFEKYARSVGITGDFDHAVILNDYASVKHSNGSVSVGRLTDNKAGDTIKIGMMDSSDSEKVSTLEFTISAVTDKKAMGTAEIEHPQFYLSSNYYNRSKLKLAEGYAHLYVNPGDKNDDITAYLLTTYDDTKAAEDENYRHPMGMDIKAQIQQTRNIMLLAEIFLYGFIIVVALIGVTNIFNTISTNILLRAKEFAMLKSIGMTDSEFNRMVWLESILYTLRALVIGIPIGIVISYGVHVLLTNGGINLSYAVPIQPIIIAVLAVALLISAIMHFSVRQISKQNIIETIRKDTI